MTAGGVGGLESFRHGHTAAGGLPPTAALAILGGMGGKLALTLLHCVLGPVLILAGLALAVRLGGDDPVSGFALVAIAVVFPVFVMTRVAWAAGYAAGRRERRSDPARG